MSKTKWLVINGKAEVAEGQVRHIGATTAPRRKKGESPSPEAAEPPWSLVRSDVYFQEGEINCEVFIEKEESKIQFRLGVDGNRTLFVGLNIRDAAYGAVLVDRSSAQEAPAAKSLSGPGNHPPAGAWIPVRIRVRGSNLEFFVQNIRVATLPVTLARAQIELSVRGYGVCEARNIAVHAVRPQVFVVMQFTEEFTALYKDVIAPVCTEFGYEVVRGDNMYTSGLILEDIIRSIRDSALVIADITPNNANVYYEVGYAHGVSKPTILLSDRKRDKLPFDISGFRLLFYDNSIGGKSEVESMLRKHLESIRAA